MIESGNGGSAKGRAMEKARADGPAQPADRDRLHEAAYLIWEREGRPEGQDVAHWLEAERQLAGETGGDGSAAMSSPSPEALTAETPASRKPASKETKKTATKKPAKTGARKTAAKSAPAAETRSGAKGKKKPATKPKKPE